MGKLWLSSRFDRPQKYNNVIARIEANTNPILQANSENTFIDDVKAREVATALDVLILDHFDADVYERRNQLCG